MVPVYLLIVATSHSWDRGRCSWTAEAKIAEICFTTMWESDCI